MRNQMHTVYVNKKTYEKIVERLQYIPINLKINLFVKDGLMIVDKGELYDGKQGEGISYNC